MKIRFDSIGELKEFLAMFAAAPAAPTASIITELQKIAESEKPLPERARAAAPDKARAAAPRAFPVQARAAAAKKRGGGQSPFPPIDAALLDKMHAVSGIDIVAYLGISQDRFYRYRRIKKAPREVIEKLNEYFARLDEEIPKKWEKHADHLPAALPFWVKEIRDKEKRNLVEQEWFVNPERAAEYADCPDAEAIRELRKEYAQ
jgi:hypothetical protein